MIDISRSDLAEAIFWFVSMPDVYMDFCEKNELEEISMAEYVNLYKRHEFEKYCQEMGYAE